jgi:DNA polymerase I-like protein with 3'-5' exonuclease and polymerase domains
MFDKRFRPSSHKRQEGEYNLSLPISAKWGDAQQRVLLVLETIDSQDLKEQSLLFDRSKTVLTNLMQYTMRAAKSACGFSRKDAAFACVNFNNEKFMDKDKKHWPGYRAKFADRVRKIIKEMEPTHVIVFGDWAMKALMPDMEYVEKKRGWVWDYRVGRVRCKISHTLDLQPLYTPKKAEDAGDDEDDDDDDAGGDDKDVFGKANLLFYVSRNVMNGLAGEMIYGLSHVKANPIYIDTMPKFKKFWKKLKAAEVASCDTEGRNLTVNHNAIHTFQFSFGTKKGYVIPFNDPNTPWTADELKFIKKKLRAWFGAKPGKLPLKYIIFQYGMFDLRAIRVELGLPVIHHHVWEITAGEYCLDENLKYLRDAPFRTPHGGLEQIFMSYGNDHYKTAKFSKEDRADSSKTKLDNPEFIEYAAMDTQSIFGIYKMQLKRASHLMVGDKPFLPYYLRLVSKQMSHTVHVISHMTQRGIAIDKLYLATLKSNQSPLLKLINEVQGKLNETAEVKAANKKLLKEASGQSSSKGLFNREPWVLDWGKYDHKSMVFFNILGLKAVSQTKTGAAQINKTFVAAYKREQPIVEQFGRYQKLTKLWSAYVKGWWNKIQESPDAKVDFRLRPGYGFFDVVTGRLNSFGPSLQQVPTRGAESKYIKRMFTSPPGTMHIKFDYSAHEVRVWSYVSGELKLADVFRVGQKLRQKLRTTKDPDALVALFKQIKVEGDIHIINVKRFLGQVVDKEHPLRDAIKSVVFGVLYGKGAGTLARDIVANNTNTTNDKIDKTAAQIKEFKDEAKMKAKIKAVSEALEKEKDKAKKEMLAKELADLKNREWAKAKVKELTATVAKLEEEKAEIPKKYTKDFAADIIGKLFGDFNKGAKWLDWTKQHARENCYTYSPIGMRRNLFSMLTGINSIMAAMERRAANSPIQGFASQIGITAARLVVLELYKVLQKFGYIDKKTREMPAEILKAVHDALYSEVPYEIVLIYVHVLQWVATYGVTAYYKEEFGVEFPIEPEIELEFGATEDKAYKWNWTDSHLRECLANTLKDQKAIGTLKEDPEEILKKIYSVYDDKEKREYLETNYPILGVLPEPKAKKAKKKEAAEA